MAEARGGSGVLGEDAASPSPPARGLSTGVDKGGPGPPIAGQKFFLVKTGLSSLPPAKSGRACYDNPTGRGHFYQMPNMYTCIAYLIEIRKFCSKKPGS